jgi:carboxymethylenebutenolidase
MDIWGVRDELYDIARSVGAVGYCCVVPDLYYRDGRRIHFDFRNERNQTISRDRLEGEKLRAILARPQLTNTMVMDDTGAVLKFLESSAFVRQGGVGALGYCMGGRYAMSAAGTYPETVIASASLHGTALISEQKDSPHRLAARLRGEFYCGFAEHDIHAPPPLVREMEEILDQLNTIRPRKARVLGMRSRYAQFRIFGYLGGATDGIDCRRLRPWLGCPPHFIDMPCSRPTSPRCGGR